jgi:hypothetical protein
MNKLAKFRSDYEMAGEVHFVTRIGEKDVDSVDFAASLSLSIVTILPGANIHGTAKNLRIGW